MKHEPDRSCRRCGRPCWGRLCWECFSTNKGRVTTRRNRRMKSPLRNRYGEWNRENMKI